MKRTPSVGQLRVGDERSLEVGEPGRRIEPRGDEARLLVSGRCRLLALSTRA
jgi:hypothetical protein